jgi:hypothetical protein
MLKPMGIEKKPGTPLPQKYEVMCTVDAGMWQVKISPVYKIVLTGPLPECTAL